MAAGLLFLACWFAMSALAAAFVAWLTRRVRQIHIQQWIHHTEHYANHPGARHRDQDWKETS